MDLVKNIKVSLRFDDEDILVGELIHQKGKVYFKYAPEFLSSGLDLSPYKLPLKGEVFTGPFQPFEGLFGVFEDSLPDGWGRLLLDRKLLKQGISPQEISPLDRLSFVGEMGAGALVYHPLRDIQEGRSVHIHLEDLERDTQLVYEGANSEVLDKLFALGGSSGGARPKISVGYNKSSKQLMPETQQLPDGFEHWLVKFPAMNDLPDIAEVEFAYYLMAKDAGIDMMESELLTGATGRKYFATKRFDRDKNKRLHRHSMAGLLHDDFRRSGIDYGHLMDAAFTLERDVRVYEKVLRLCTFNVFTHNRDDHSKNFSFLMDAKGIWKFAPAYDLTFSSSSHGMHSTTVAGEGESPNSEHIIELANEFGVKNIPDVIAQVLEVTKKWNNYANLAGVSEDTRKMISKKLDRIRK